MMMLKLQRNIPQRISLILFNFGKAKEIGTFKSRIQKYKNSLDYYDRQFHMRAPDLSTKNQIVFPIKIPFRVRHRFNNKNWKNKFLDNTQKINWNRLTPNQILLAFERYRYLTFDQLVEGLKYLSEVKGQEQHDWNTHPWISTALNYILKHFNRIKQTDYLKFYYLMKKLNYKNQQFWKKIYQKIEDKIYDLYPSEFETFMLRYYKVSDQYFSPEMKQKWLTLMEGRLRQFKPENILKIFQIYYEQNRLDQYWKYNVFVPLFKDIKYDYRPNQLCQIFRFMILINHEKDGRLYDALYKRIYKFKFKTKEQIQNLIEVIGEIKDLFISHRVNDHLDYLNEKKNEFSNKKVQKIIRIEELVRQDLIFFLQKRKINSQITKEGQAAV